MSDGLFEQIIEEAAFYWFQRNHAVDSPFYTLKNLIELDRRLAGLLRLMASLDGFHDFLNSGFNSETELEFYCAIGAASPMRNINLFQIIKNSIKLNSNTNEIVNMLSWVEYKSISGLLRKLWESDNTELQNIALGVWKNHRKKTDIDLPAAMNSSDPETRAISAQFAGEMGMTQHLEQIAALLNDDNEKVRFWAAYSVILLGGDQGLSLLFNTIQEQKEQKNLAIQLTFPILTEKDATKWINTLSRNDNLLQETIKSFEVVGLSRFIPWLISLTKSPSTAPFAAHAFCTITGMSIESEDFGELIPILGDPTAIDSEDFEKAVKAIGKIDFNALWTKYNNRFSNESRYFFGKTITDKNMSVILKNGNQQQRKRAALEQAILSPEKELFQHRAPGFRQ
ncbi:MAG: hypothetical protein D6B27_01410 [Gammaproteobacteria bacterium]|nr:MAG: hypothetical protein D6B27_01410 [Gammaproteobacteria bacterium]